MYLYIAYRNLKDHFIQNNAYGGVPVNHDYRFTAVKDGIYYLLTQDNTNYAVSKEEGMKFIEDVLSKCTGEHIGLFPSCASIDGKETAAVVELTRPVECGNTTRNEYVYCDMDADVLLQMLEDLKSRSGEPMDSKTLMNYCYPNSVLPEEDFQLDTIYHGIYCKPDNKPNSVIQTFFPDKMVSHFWTRKDGLSVGIREGDNTVTYDVPVNLLPEIKDKVRQLCKDPVGAYVEHGDWEGFIRFGKNGDERIFTDPDKTLELLKEIASQGTVLSTETVDKSKFYPVNQSTAGFNGLGMMGFFMSQSVNPPPEPSHDDGPKCPCCGAPRTAGKFCTECGAEYKNN